MTGYTDSLARLELFFNSKCQTDDEYGKLELDEGEVEMVEEMLAEAYSASQLAHVVDDVVVEREADEESPFGNNSQLEYSQGSQNAYNPVDALKKYREHYAKDVKPPVHVVSERRTTGSQDKPAPELISMMTSQEVFSTALHSIELEQQQRQRRESEKIIEAVESIKKEPMIRKAEEQQQVEKEELKAPVKMVTKTANAIMNILGNVGEAKKSDDDTPRPHTFKPRIPETITIPTVVVTPLETFPLPSLKETITPIVDDLAKDKELPPTKPLASKPAINPAPFIFDGPVESESAAKRTRTFNALSSPIKAPKSPLFKPQPPVIIQPKIDIAPPPVIKPSLSPKGIAIKGNSFLSFLVDAAKAMPKDELPVFTFSTSTETLSFNTQMQEAASINVDALPRFAFENA